MAARRRLTPREAAAYLAELGTPFKVTTLEAWRCHGKGPRYYRQTGGRRIFYDPADLEAFALGEPVLTTDSVDVAPPRQPAADRRG